jgi:WD40 repeat protein
MSLDRLLRDGLGRSSIGSLEPLDLVLDHVVVRGRRRRRIRRALIALCTVGAVAAAVVVLPSALEAIRNPARPGPATHDERPDRTLGAPLLAVEGYGLGFSADGRLVFARSRDGLGLVYDTLTGREIDASQGRRGNTTVAFSPDGRLFVTARGGQSVSELDTYVNDRVTGRQLVRVRKTCCFVAFSSDGRMLALPFAGRTRVIDVESGDLIGEYEAFGTIVFSPDGRRLMVSSSQEGVLADVFDLDEAGGDAVLTLYGDHGGDAFGTMLAWSPDGSTLVTATPGGDAVLWDAATGGERLVIASPAGQFTSLSFGSDPTRLATGSSDGTATVWELSPDGAAPVLSRETGAGGTAFTVALSPDGAWLMTTAGAYETAIWSTTLGPDPTDS